MQQYFIKMTERLRIIKEDISSLLMECVYFQNEGQPISKLMQGSINRLLGKYEGINELEYE